MDRDRRSNSRDRRSQDRAERRGRGDRGPNGAEASDAARLIARIKKRIAGNATHIYRGTSRGEPTIANSAVLLQEKVWSTVRHAEFAKLKLPEDVKVGKKWITRTDHTTRQHVDLLLELVAPGGTTAHAMSSGTKVRVHRISGGTDLVPHNEVTATDWLRLLVREQALMSDSAENAREALAAMTVGSHEAWASAAGRVLLAFRATLATASRPHQTETEFFWK